MTTKQQTSLFLWFLILYTVFSSQSEGETCKTWSGHPGKCVLHSECKNLRELISKNELPVTCGLGVYEEVICCPCNECPSVSEGTNTGIKVSKERAAVEACIEYDKSLKLVAHPLIMGGTKVPLGEYPHSAALGYPIIGTDDFDFRCGASLIHARFVLTAAHCVIRRDATPTFVRLGFVDFNDKNQTLDALQIPIKKIHIHPYYTNSQVYNDISLVELERNVSFSWKIRPVCLYTLPEDPPPQYELYVTGWGVTNLATRKTSSALLKAQVFISTVEQCNSTYAGKRKVRHGLDNTHMCAYDPRGARDACQGDSGGPLNLVVDNDYLKYRLVGIISAGLSCGTTTPSLYTRVSAHLDFIESIVWPITDTCFSSF